MERPKGDKRIERTAHTEEQWKLKLPGGVFESLRGQENQSQLRGDDQNEEEKGCGSRRKMVIGIDDG